jgi:hypothetical protein
MDVFLEFGVALENLYQWLSEAFQQDREVSETFDFLRLQKRGHADLLRNQRKMAALKGDPPLPVVPNLDEIGHLLDEIEVFRGRGDSPDLIRAIELSKSLEDAAAEKLHRSGGAGGDLVLASVIDKLARDDRKHLGLLETLRERVLGMAS